MEKKHSGLGIASFIISLGTGVATFFLFAVLGAMEYSKPGSLDEESPAAMMAGVLILGFVMADIIALVLGIIGALQKDRKPIFAILGSVLSGLALLGMLGIIVLGLALA